MVPLYVLILVPILAGLALMALPLRWGKALALASQIPLAVMAGQAFLTVRRFGPRLQVIGGWPQTAGITLRAELLSLDLVLLSILLFACLLLYNNGKPYVNKTFLFLFLSFQGLVNGIFLSVDLFNIFVLVEVSTVVISLLILFKPNSESIYDGMIYLLTNIVAMTFFLFGLGLLYKTTGAVDLDSLKRVISGFEDSDRLILPYAFLMTAVSLKAALMPLFSWLPKAHGTPGAPTIVSAVLSGLYVKCGVYLFFRLQDVFEPVLNTRSLFLVLGLLTAVIGFILAIAQKDIKLILAYHTVSQIGLIMTGLNMDHDYARYGALYHIINHAIFKATLFLTAGLISERYKTRQIGQIRGVWREMPAVALASLLAILGITGAPLFNGSMSKAWIMYGAGPTGLSIALYIINLGTVVSFVKYASMLWGKPPEPSEAPFWGKPGHRLPALVCVFLGLLCLLGGILSEPMTRLLFGVALPVDWSQYGRKTLIFLLLLGAGASLYHFGLKRWRYLQQARGLDLSFHDICLTLAAFFAGLVIILKIWY
ncbi:MAG: proton-conducting membrane transporter [Clostridiaceae bacterium]|nr:proton-conducting membrane transporter [Clostridiaceae bacterium]